MGRIPRRHGARHRAAPGDFSPGVGSGRLPLFLAAVVLCVIGAGITNPSGQRRVSIARRTRAARIEAPVLAAPTLSMPVAVPVVEPVTPPPAPAPVPAPTHPAKVDAYRQQTVPTGTTAAQVLSNRNLSLPPDARKDLIDGVVAQPVLDFLAWATQGHSVAVSVFKTGHTEYVEGTVRVSLHFEGRGVDIMAIDRQPVTLDDAGGRVFAQAVAALKAGRPTEVGSPWADIVLPGFFSDPNHLTHIHLGWAAV